MTHIERWRNSETGEIYEIEWPDLPPAEHEPERPQLPVATQEPIEASDAVLAAPDAPEPKRLDPRRARLMARIMRQILETPDDAA